VRPLVEHGRLSRGVFSSSACASYLIMPHRNMSQDIPRTLSGTAADWVFVPTGFPHSPLPTRPVLISDVPATRSVSAACAGVGILLARCSRRRPPKHRPPSLRPALTSPSRAGPLVALVSSSPGYRFVFSLAVVPHFSITLPAASSCACGSLALSNPFSFVSISPPPTIANVRQHV